MEKYIITVKEDNRILAMGRELDYMDNGYPRLIEENVAFPIQLVNVYGPVAVPEEVEPEKYCYDGTDFTLNPNYKEPEE